MTSINAHTKTVRQLLENVSYSIDFYQREYAWERRHIQDLLDDLEGAFLTDYAETHQRLQDQDISRYFLGTIITVTENQKRFIVDGQQRLTTLTLLLIYIRHLLRSVNAPTTDVSSLILADCSGSVTFNINVSERADCMNALYQHGYFDPPVHANLSVRYLANRYRDIGSYFPERLKGNALPRFANWLVDNVDLVEIETVSGHNTFLMFETMNDRGRGLDSTDLLKGYLLTKITGKSLQQVQQSRLCAEETWRNRIRQLYLIPGGEDERQRFFTTWLRAKYAESNQEFARITNTRFHRWVRNNEARLELNEPQDFYDFIVKRFDHFAEHYLSMREWSRILTVGHEEIYYNEFRGFKLQFMLALAPIQLDDSIEVVHEKMRLVATFIDIYSARRMVNYTYSTSDSTIFNLAKGIRNLQIPELRTHLLHILDNMEYSFDRLRQFGLYRTDRKHIHYLLARMTVWVEQQCGLDTAFNDYDGSQGTPYEIEHIFSSDYSNHSYGFSSEEDFDDYRNNIGALLLLPKYINRSLGDARYEHKVKQYANENLRAASLSTQTDTENPNFAEFVQRSGLPFKSYDYFHRLDVHKRADLYRQICERIWSPDRLLESS